LSAFVIEDAAEARRFRSIFLQGSAGTAFYRGIGLCGNEQAIAGDGSRGFLVTRVRAAGFFSATIFAYESSGKPIAVERRAQGVSTNMSSKNQKLRLIGAFAALATLALGASCRGFFVNPTLTAITISPSAPQVQVNSNVSLTLYGTYNDGSTGQVRSGVTWSSSEPSVASFSSPTSNLLQGFSLGTTTITANAQAVSGTATATVFLGGISAITVTPTSGVATVSTGQSATFTFNATASGTQIPITTTNGGILTITPSTTFVTCTPSGNQMICSAASGASFGTYSVVMTYPGTSASATASLSVPN
jgi:hypothetical protein